MACAPCASSDTEVVLVPKGVVGGSDRAAEVEVAVDPPSTSPVGESGALATREAPPSAELSAAIAAAVAPLPAPAVRDGALATLGERLLGK